MNNPVKTYAVPFTSDGSSLSLEIDLSTTPVLENLRGNSIVGVILPGITVPVGVTANPGVVTATFLGSIVTIQWTQALPELNNSVAVIYAANFTIQFEN